MKNKINKLKGSRVEIEVTLDDKEFQQYYQPQYDAAASSITIKGFRPGTAPKNLVDQAIDHEKLFTAAVQDAVRSTLDDIKKENNWSLIDHPKVEVTDSKEGVTYKATLTLFPEVELGDYRKIAKKVFSQKNDVKVTDEEIDKTLEYVVKSRAAETRVARVAATGDLVEIDIETASEGKPVENGSFKNDRFILGESHFIEGFDKKLEGKKEGDTATFQITAPKNYWQKELQGKTLDFTVKVNGVFERKVPALNDEFAQTLGPTFKTVDDMKKSVREGLTMEKQDKEIEKLRIQAIEQIAKDAKMDVAEILVERTLDGIVADMKRMAPPDANKNPEALEKEMREKLRDRAVGNVRGNLAMYQIAKVEKLEPTKEEVEAEAKKHGFDLNKEYDYIYGTLQNQKVFKFLESQATHE